jgi:hypothetical protein
VFEIIDIYFFLSSASQLSRYNGVTLLADTENCRVATQLWHGRSVRIAAIFFRDSAAAVTAAQAFYTRWPMVSDSERNQLLSDYGRESRSVARLLLTCAAGLLILFALAWAGLDIQHVGADAPGQAPVVPMVKPAS